jgi:hypothetical protein
MPQSLAKVYVHLIFSTKDREQTLPDEIRPDLHAYMGGILYGLGCAPIEINTEPDHAHVFFLLSRTVALRGAKLVRPERSREVGATTFALTGPSLRPGGVSSASMVTRF